MSADGKPDFTAPFEPAREAEEGAKTGADPDTGADGDGVDTRHLRNIAEEISRTYAPQLEHTALVLYDRDPNHLQAQWYVTPEELAQARSVFPGDGASLRQVLRLCRLGQGRPEVVANVPQGLGGAKSEGEEDFALHDNGAEYECELGLESDDGGWLLLARSNRIVLADRSPPPAPAVPAPRVSQTREPPDGDGWSPNTGEDGLVEAALAAFGEPLFPVFPNLEPDEIPAPQPSLPAQEARGNGQILEQMPKARHDSLEWPEPDPQTLTSLPPGAHLAPMPPPLLPSGPEPREALSTEMAGARYDPRAALSSATLGHGVHLSGMEIEAELIVQGRATPDTTVDLFGLPVAAGADGRFYIHRPIDDPALLSLALGRRQPPE